MQGHVTGVVPRVWLKPWMWLGLSLSGVTPLRWVLHLEGSEFSDRLLRGEGMSMSTAQACRVLGISEATLCRWRQRYGSMNRREAKEPRELRKQNARLKQLLGQAEIEKAALRELAEGNF